MLQLQDTLDVRFGVMLVGRAMTGKSTIRGLLASSCNASGRRVFSSALNPKSLSLGELYGEVDSGTGEWRDGLASFIIRGHNQPGVD